MIIEERKKEREKGKEIITEERKTEEKAIKKEEKAIKKEGRL